MRAQQWLLKGGSGGGGETPVQHPVSSCAAGQTGRHPPYDLVRGAAHEFTTRSLHALTGLRVLGASPGHGLRRSRVICSRLAPADSEGPDLGIRGCRGCSGQKSRRHQPSKA